MRYFEKLVEIEKDEIFLIEIIEQPEVTVEPGEFPVILKDTEEEGVERADVHFVEIDGDVLGKELRRNTGYEFFCGFFREGWDENILGFDTFLDEIDDAIDKGFGFAWAGAGND